MANICNKEFCGAEFEQNIITGAWECPWHMADTSAQVLNCESQVHESVTKMAKSYEICGCKAIGDSSVEQVPDKEAEFFGVYETAKGGFSHWIADFKTKAAAKRHVAELEAIL